MAIAVVAGATGLIGSQLLELLLELKNYERVVALTRRPLTRAHSRFQNLVVDFDKLGESPVAWQDADVFCCLGTTIKKAGSQSAFRKVDFDYVVALATTSKKGGARQFLLVTAMGSDSGSMIFYNRVKGDVEKAVIETGFSSLHIFRPSMLVVIDRIKEQARGLGRR